MPEPTAEKLCRLGGYTHIAHSAVHLQDEMDLLANERAATKRHDEWLYAGLKQKTGKQPQEGAVMPTEDDMGNLSIGDQTHTHYHYQNAPQTTTQNATVPKSGLGGLAKTALITGAALTGLGGAGAVGYLASQALNPAVVQPAASDPDTDTSVHLELLTPLPPPQEPAQ